MGHMVMADIMEEESARPAEQRAIDCCGSTSQESPRAFAVVRDRRIRMVQESEHDCQQ